MAPGRGGFGPGKRVSKEKKGQDFLNGTKLKEKQTPRGTTNLRVARHGRV